MMVIPSNSASDSLPHPGTFWMAIFSVSLIVLMLAAVAAFILRLRYRARHPLDAPTSLEEALGADEPGAGDESNWERSANWWKEGE